LLTKNALVRTSEFPLSSNVSKRAQFSCECFTSAIVTRLIEYNDVIQSLLRRAPRPGLTLGPAPARADPGCSIGTKRAYAITVSD